MASKQELTIDQRVAAYRNKLVQARTNPPPPKPDRATVRRERLEAVEVRMHASDLRRMRMLLQEARLHLDDDNMSKAYSVSVEFAHMARLMAVGLEQTHPVLPSTPPPSRMSSLPPGTDDVIDVGAP